MSPFYLCVKEDPMLFVRKFDPSSRSPPLLISVRRGILFRVPDLLQVLHFRKRPQVCSQLNCLLRQICFCLAGHVKESESECSLQNANSLPPNFNKISVEKQSIDEEFQKDMNIYAFFQIKLYPRIKLLDYQKAKYSYSKCSSKRAYALRLELAVPLTSCMNLTSPLTSLWPTLGIISYLKFLLSYYILCKQPSIN